MDVPPRIHIDHMNSEDPRVAQLCDALAQRPVYNTKFQTSIKANYYAKVTTLLPRFVTLNNLIT